MLVLKDLENRVYRGKECVAFSYSILNEKKERQFVARFETGKGQNEWNMQIVLERTRDADSQVYNFGYVMPRPGLPLTLIAATGLRYFQLYIKEELNTKTQYDFILSDILKGM